MTDHVSPVPRPEYEQDIAERLEWRRLRLASLRGRLRVVFWLLATSIIMCVGAVAVLAVAILTLFQARRFYAEVMTRNLARAVLWAAGVRMVVHQELPFPGRQTVYVSNHTSTLDVFLLLAIGLPNSRYFMGGFLRKIIPLGIVTHIIGTFHTPLQTYPDRRVRCFQNAERVLRRTGESVYLSPEGQRITGGSIGHFNKGAFHLATNLQVPILPLYIDIPAEIDPQMGYQVVPGEVHVCVLPEISTEGWTLEDLEQNKQSVRDTLVQFQNQLRSGQRQRETPGNMSTPSSCQERSQP